jgi:Vps51/Vps67
VFFAWVFPNVPDRNYAEFVAISKDISTLENEMLELKSILEEWKAVPGSLEIASSLHSDVALCMWLLADTLPLSVFFTADASLSSR